MATLLPAGEIQFCDSVGNPLAGGSVAMFVPGTFTPKDTWTDSDQNTLNTNPIGLDSAGRAIIYGSGLYRQRLFDSAGNLVWDQLTASTDSGGIAWGGVSTGSANAQVIAASSFSQQDGQQVSFLAGFSNSTALTVAPGGGTGIPVLLDNSTGPQPLTGGEVIAGNAVVLVYDAIRGAFHLINPAAGSITAGVISGSTISTSTILLKQSSDPSPTAEGDIQWSTLFDHIKIGDAAATKRFLPGPAPGSLYGCTIANNGSDATNDIDFAAGQIADSTNAFYLIASALTKQLDGTWAVGANQGGLFSGSIANTTYHCFVIMRPDTGVVDAGFDTSVIAANRPVAYTYFRRVGSFIRTGAAIKPFIQYGDTFTWGTPVSDLATANPGVSAVTRTLTLPIGINILATVVHQIFDTGTSLATTGLLTDLASADVTPTTTVYDVLIGSTGTTDLSSSTTKQVRTNTSAQIRSRLSTSTSAISEDIVTFGWVDTRGRT